MLTAVLCAASQLAIAAASGAALSFKDCAACPEMVAIPPGEFVMGVAPGEEARVALPEEFRHRSEPQRRVIVRGFAAGRYEITRAQYGAFAAETRHAAQGCFFWNGDDWEMDPKRDWRDPGYPQGDDHPVTCVSWNDATAYAQWLSAKTSQRYRLLTEAEWEYAARAGTTTARYWGEDPDASCAYANGGDVSALRQAPGAINWPIANCDDGYVYTAPVASFRPNAYGLHDMLGNAWEWTQDCWNANHAGAAEHAGARAGGDCELRVVRGGSWDDTPALVRAAYRVGSPVVIRVYGRGFRVARDE